MRNILLGINALLGLLPPLSAAAQKVDVTVYAAPARFEIERILATDNLDTGALESRVVAEAMVAIARGRAPNDFWSAYQAHVAAWQHFAAVEGRAKIVQDDVTSIDDTAAALASAKRQIETTFDEVERVARRYGARIPFYR